MLFKEKNDTYWFANMTVNEPLQKWISKEDLYFLKDNGFITIEDNGENYIDAELIR